MEQYIGTKIVQAEPAAKCTCRLGGAYNANVIMTKEEIADREAVGWELISREGGYKVVYEGGYESWSPKETFEKAYRRTDGLNFGLAIEAAKTGKRIARAGWNGKNQYVELGHNLGYNTSDGKDACAFHQDIGSRALVFVGTRGSQVGWLASQSDMLADDWYIVE